MGGLLVILSQYSVMYGLDGCRVLVGITMANSGLTSGCSFCPFFLAFSSSLSSQSEVTYLVGHSFSNGVHMAQCLGSSLVCVEAVDEGGKGRDGLLLTNWLLHTRARLDDVLYAGSIALWVRFLPDFDFQSNWFLVDVGNLPFSIKGFFCTITFLGLASLFISGLEVSCTRFLFLGIFFGFGW